MQGHTAVTMVWNPPKQPVNVTRMVIYSLIPILSIYAGWRIQKFWMLVIINFLIGFGVNIAVGYPLGNPYIGSIISIPISIFVVWHYAKAYNVKIAASTTAAPPS
jgi:hypothetical protein